MASFVEKKFEVTPITIKKALPEGFRTWKSFTFPRSLKKVWIKIWLKRWTATWSELQQSIHFNKLNKRPWRRPHEGSSLAGHPAQIRFSTIKFRPELKSIIYDTESYEVGMKIADMRAGTCCAARSQLKVGRVCLRKWKRSNLENPLEKKAIIPLLG